MNKKIVYSILISGLMILSLAGCSKSNDKKTSSKETKATAVYEAKVRSGDINTTATILDKLSNSNDNVVISPLSLDISLGIVANGATDTVKKDISTYLNTSIDDFNKFVKDFQLNKSSGITTANSLWIKDGNKINEKTDELLFNNYDTELFEHKFDKTLIDDANLWCSTKTNKLIPSILDSVPDGDSVLLSALYFNSNWQAAFDKDNTSKDTFKVNGKDTKVDTLHSTEYFYYKNDKATAFGKNYVNNRYKCIGILPNDEKYNIADLDLDKLLKSETESTVNVSMPKFTVEYSTNLNDALKNVGLTSIFENNAFDSILEDKSIAISDVMQKNKVIVNEAGTEAASTTKTEIKTTAMTDNAENVKTVKLNRPFVYMIYDTQAETPLFIGNVVNPTK